MQKIIFFGVGKFAVPAIKKLKENFEIALVVTSPEKPVGRNRKITPSPVRIEAKKLNLKTLTVDKFIPEVIKKIKSATADLFVIIDYGKIIPQEVLKIAPHGAINVHPSKLPLYRGASPLQSAIANGEDQTAISIMLIDEEMDHGPILAQKITNIKPDDTYGLLYQRLSCEYPNFLIDTIKKYLERKIKPQEQNHSKATFTKILKREDGRINWNNNAKIIEKMIRAYNPWPGTFFEHEKKRIKVFQASASDKKYPNKKIGDIFKTESGNVAVACGQNTTLLIHRLQPEGKKELSEKEFIQGYLK